MLYLLARDHEFSGEIQNWGWMYRVNMGDGWREGYQVTRRYMG